MGLSRSIVLLVTALVLSASIVFVPFPYSAIIVFVFLAFLAVFLYPKITMLSLALFLPFQKLLALRTEWSMSYLSLFFKRLEEGLVLVAFIVILTDRVFLRKLKYSGIELPLGVLLIIALLGTLQSKLVSYNVALFDLFLLLKGFFVFYIFYSLRFTLKDIKGLSKVFLIVGLFVLALGAVDLAMPARFRALIGNVSYVSYRFGIPSVQSIFVHPGGFGWFTAFFASFALAFFVVFDKKKYLFFAILFGIGTVVSMRFKSVVGFAVVGSFVLLLTSKTNRINLIFSLGLFLTLFVLLFGQKAWLLFEDKLYTYFQAPAQYDVARNVLYDTGLRIAVDYFPFGSGLGTYGGWIAALYRSPLYFSYGINNVWGLDPISGGWFLTDTFWPYILGQFGFFGCFCYASIIVSFLVRSIKSYFCSEDKFIKAFSLGSFLMLIEALVESVAEPVFSTPPQYFYIFACIGIVYSFTATQSGRKVGTS